MQQTILTRPDDLRSALASMRPAAQGLLKVDPTNWRRQMLDLSDAFFRGPDELKTLAAILQENRDVDGARWAREASAGKPPPLPAKRYDRLALVFQLVTGAARKAGAGSIAENIDLPFALENAWPGLDKAAAYRRFRDEVLAPFVAELDKFAAAIEAKLPGHGKVDVREAAMKAFKAAPS